MADQFQKYCSEIEALFADEAMVAAMRQRMPNSADEIDRGTREKRWQAAVETFCAADANWWTEKPHGK